MNTRCEFLGQCRVNPALSLDARHAVETVRNDAHGKMGLPARFRPGMSGVPVAVIDNVHRIGRKGSAQLGSYVVGD